MKKIFLLCIVIFCVQATYSQKIIGSKNRLVAAPIDTTIDGVWAGIDSVEYCDKVIDMDSTTINDTVYDDSCYMVLATDLADSIYLTNTGIPDYGDLYAPDLEVKVKTVWYQNMLYFLIRRLDDNLINGYTEGVFDDSIKSGMENLDATVLYFFMDTLQSYRDTDPASSSYGKRLYRETSRRNDVDNDIYSSNEYLDSIVWIRWVQGSDMIEGEIGTTQDISSIDDVGGEIIHWTDERYYYTKLSIDMSVIAPKYSNFDSLAIGFDIEVNENDREYLVDGFYPQQTRVFFGDDMDSSAIEPRNVSNWSWLWFTYGDPCTECEGYTFVNVPIEDFALIYPNPAKEYITIRLDEAIKTDYSLFNMMGQLLQSGTVYERESKIDLYTIQSGTYFLQLRQKNRNPIVEKLLIF